MLPKRIIDAVYAPTRTATLDVDLLLLAVEQLCGRLKHVARQAGYSESDVDNLTLSELALINRVREGLSERSAK